MNAKPEPEQTDDRLSERVAALSEAQRALLARRLESLSETPTVSAPAARDGLVAHFVVVAGRAPTPQALREHLAARLPAHMLPSRFVPVPALQRTSAGKIDRRALSDPRPEQQGDTCQTPATPSRSPAGDAEHILARIWMDVLGVSEVAVDEDFFELGGDSLLSIRILSRAGQQGLRISAEAFFADPTIAGQARAAGAADGTATERGPVTGSLALTPVQRRLFGHLREQAHHWNHSRLFELRKPLALSTLERAVQALMHHHDALRLQFNGTDGQAQIVAPGSQLPVSHFDLGACSDERLALEMHAIAARLNASLDLGRAPLFHAALLETRAGLSDRLLWVAHQVLVDDASWRVLLEDLDRACTSDEAGEAIRLPARTTSCKRWSEHLLEYAHSDLLRREFDYWRGVCAAPFALPLDDPAGAADNRVRSARTCSVTLPADTTSATLRELTTEFRVGVDTLLLTALALALRRWRGPGPVRLALQGDTRATRFEHIDLSRTVGWFASLFPLCVEIRDPQDPVAALREVRTQTAAVPNGGIGFGLLSELCEDAEVVSALRAQSSQVLFNYRGPVDHAAARDRLVLEHEDFGGPRAPDGLRAHVLEVDARIEDDLLRVDWSYSEAIHREATIAALADDFSRTLDTLIARVRGGETTAVHPDDFPLARLDQHELDSIASALGEFDDEDDTTGDSR